MRIRWIGRKQGLLTRVSEVLKSAPPETRKDAGKRFNALKSAIEPRCDPDHSLAEAKNGPPATRSTLLCRARAAPWAPSTLSSRR